MEREKIREVLEAELSAHPPRHQRVSPALVDRVARSLQRADVPAPVAYLRWLLRLRVPLSAIRYEKWTGKWKRIAHLHEEPDDAAFRSWARVVEISAQSPENFDPSRVPAGRFVSEVIAQRISPWMFVRTEIGKSVLLRTAPDHLLDLDRHIEWCELCIESPRAAAFDSAFLRLGIDSGPKYAREFAGAVAAARHLADSPEVTNVAPAVTGLRRSRLQRCP